jgi:hypothetical protein
VEACLFAMGRLADNITEAGNSNKVQLDLPALFNHVIQNLMNVQGSIIVHWHS